MLVSSGIHPYAHLSLHSHSVTLLSRIHSLHSPELHPHFVARFRLHPKPLCSFFKRHPPPLFRAAYTLITHSRCIHSRHFSKWHPSSSLIQAASTLVPRSSYIHPLHSFELHPNLRCLLELHPHLVALPSSIHACPSFRLHPRLSLVQAPSALFIRSSCIQNLGAHSSRIQPLSLF